jgi:hypothetical protein
VKNETGSALVHGVLRAACCLLASSALLPAQWHPQYQEYYPHHNFTFGVGVAEPKADLGSYYVNRPGITIGYGYRFDRYFQADLGLDMVFGAAHVRDYLNTDFGPLRIRDRQFFVPFGGRAILPLIHGRLLISGGGGGAYLRYAELLHQPSYYFKIDCPVCVTRDGWAYYALTDVSGFLDHNQHFRVGVTAKSYRGHTSGDSLAGVPAVKTKDRWLDILGNVGFSF